MSERSIGMKRTFVLISSLCIFTVRACGQDSLTGREIYRANKDAIVQIGIGKAFSGDGFIISADGIIVTANHVVATRESKFREYAKNIVVRIVRKNVAAIYPATPIEPQISDDQVNFDTARLKVDVSDLPHVTLGSSDEVEIGTQITIIPSVPGPEVLMLEGTVSGKAVAPTDLGPKAVNTVWFQCPIHNGFSGSPIFSSKGHVIGIVDTKVFGISVSLGELRKEWLASQTQASVQISGVDVATSFLELINNLDQNLISGLGSGVAIEYAKALKNKK
jgi:Trypsin-like peptidase domain